MVMSLTVKEIRAAITGWLIDAFAKDNEPDPHWAKHANDFLKYMRSNGYVIRDLENERQMNKHMSDKVVAIVWTHEDGAEAYDTCFNWETAQVMANDGYKVQAIASDGHMSMEDIQKMCDYELDAAIDCFGEGHRK